MIPSRELDALVAEKVIGLEVQNGLVVTTRRIGGISVSVEPPAQYSTSIEAAWTVVEHMRKTHWRNAFSLRSPTDTIDSWYATFDKKWHGHSWRNGEGGDSYVTECESGDSPAHAICLAALKACGADV